MNRIRFLSGEVKSGKVIAQLKPQELADVVMKKEIVIVKSLFSPDRLKELRRAVREWGKENTAISHDEFKSNYHSYRAKISNIQQSPHVFHDYNFNRFETLPAQLHEMLTGVFEPLRWFHNVLTNRDIPLGVQEKGPYYHPQLIQYPPGGGFFGRHNHNLNPQQIGFILSLSKYGEDYPNGGTCFEIDGEAVDIEGQLDIGDLCIWRYDYDHWVKQSTLRDKFSWDTELGRWVATLAYFDPF